MKIKILDEEYGESEGPYEEYGEWSSETNHNIKGAVKVKENEYFDLEVSDDLLNKNVYLLYILYGSGDSFGESSGNIEYIDVFKSKDKAEEVQRIIEEDYKVKPDYTFEPGSMDLFYTKDNGNKAKIPTSVYKGYFENLESVNVEKISIKLVKERELKRDIKKNASFEINR